MSEATQSRDRQSLVEQMVDAGRDFYRFGWLSATSGNMSCRTADETIAITATGSHLRSLSTDDFIDVDLDGNADDGGEPSGDVDVHAALYRQLDEAGAVYHVHHLEAALCSDRDEPRGFTHFHELTMLYALGVDSQGDEPTLDIPIVDVSYDIDEMVEAVTDRVGGDEPPKAPCLNVKNHGLYVWGETPEEARRHVEACAYLFEYSWERPMNPKETSAITGFDT